MEIFPRSSARLMAISLSVPAMSLLELADQLGAVRGVAFGGIGVVADHEPVGSVGDPDFLDLHVPGDLLVAALPGQRRLDQRGLGPQLLPDDVPAGALLQEPPVPGGGEPAVGNPDDLAEHPVPHVGLDLPDQRRVGGVAGPGPDPDGDAVAGDGHAYHDLRQVVAAVLGLAVGAEPRCLARVGVLLVAGLLAAPVPHGLRTTHRAVSNDLGINSGVLMTRRLLDRDGGQVEHTDGEHLRASGGEGAREERREHQVRPAAALAGCRSSRTPHADSGSNGRVPELA